MGMCMVGGDGMEGSSPEEYEDAPWNKPPYVSKQVSLNLHILNIVAEHAKKSKLNFSQALRHLVHMGYIYLYLVLKEQEKED